MFIAGLIVGVAAGVSIVYPLLFGLVLFSGNALLKGHSCKQVAQMALSGMKRGKNTIVFLLLIGAITGIWRGCGVIPYLIYNSVGLIQPQLFLLSVFLLCAALSLITGTAFGTASTMGVVLAIMGSMNGVNPFYTCGAIMGGSYFGDRASPMSAAARLLSDITGTDYHDNFKNWIKSSAIPFALSALIYILLGAQNVVSVMHTGIVERFAHAFNLHWILMLPPAMIILLSICKVKVKTNLIVNILLSSGLAIILQQFTLQQLAHTLVLGFQTQDAELTGMLGGGGIMSMVRAAIVILISSSYIGIFEKTRLLSGFEKQLAGINSKVGAFATTLLTGVVTAAVSCNQTLSIMLTDQLCKGFYSSPSKLASDIANTTVLLAAFIPWSIACTLPLTVIGGDYRSLPFAFFMYFTPLCGLVCSQIERLRQKNK